MRTSSEQMTTKEPLRRLKRRNVKPAPTAMAIDVQKLHALNLAPLRDKRFQRPYDRHFSQQPVGAAQAARSCC